MSDAPRFTIAIPVYNGEAYLRDAIASALAQDVPDFEVIVSDNASTDRTAEICREFLGNPKFRYFHHERNLGAIGNFEFTLAASTAKYFKWLAHDDFCDPRLLSSAGREFARDDSIVCVASGVRVVDVGSHLVHEEHLTELSRPAAWPEIRPLFFDFPISNIFHAIYGVFRRDVLERCVREKGVLRTTYRNALTNGECYFLACIATCGRIVATDDVLLSYRVHAKSIYHTEVGRFTRYENFMRGMTVRWQLVSAAMNSSLPCGVRAELMLRPFRGLLRSARRRALRLFSAEAR